MTGCVVLLSGGLDSYTAAADLKAQGFGLYALSVHYGQRHAVELDAAREVAGALGVRQHLELAVDLSKVGGSALTSDIAVPKDRALDASIPVTYVPARNTVFLSLALAWAEALGVYDIGIGANALDYSGYPDCRPEYLRAFEAMANLATKAGIEGHTFRIHAPLLTMSKADIIRRGLQLGVDYGLTHSCYDPGSSRRPCGHCDSCVLRAKGFDEAGVIDPSAHTTVTNRLYYTDSHQTTFDAVVVEAGTLDGRPFAVLDQTAFYPTTGGQPHDTGLLGGRRVVDVIDREADGAILHVLEAPLPAGAAVSATLDWPRRLDHMQQHTGQHVLSAAFVRLFEIPTVSFHLGSELSTIDLTGTPGPDVIARAEDEANRIVWENRPVSVRFVSAEEASRLPLRKEPVRGGTLRLVEVEDFDLSACGGTHVTQTGSIGVIAVQAWERYKGGTRVSFACGQRAVMQFRVHRDVVAGVVRQLSIQPIELADAVTRLQNEAREMGLQVRGFTEQLAGFEAGVLAGEAVACGAARVVCKVVEGRDAAALKSLAQAVVSRPGHVVVLVGGSRPAVVVAARSADVAVDANQLVKVLLGRFGGKGGGRPEGAQGGGLDADPSAICQAAYEVLSGGGPPPSSSSVSR